MPTPPKRKPDSARRANRIIQQRTLLLLALLGIGTFLLLFAQLYKLQIKQHDELKTLAVRQQTLRTTVEASRGTIYDKNGDILALSSTAENVCVSPLDVAKNEQDQDLIANGLGEILGVDPGGLLNDMKDTASQYKVIKKKVEQETADKVRVFISDNGIKGVFLEPTSKRYYPYSSLAAHVIGFVNANGGAYGLEAVYDEELTGEKGMVISARDANGNALLYQYEQYFDAENGDSLVTTLDKTVQYYLEKNMQAAIPLVGNVKVILRQILDQFHLIRLALLLHELNGFLAGQLEALQLQLLLADLPHLGLDLGHVLRGKGKGCVHIVVPALLDGGADGQLHLGPQALDGLRHDVRAGVPVSLAVFLIFKAEFLDFLRHSNVSFPAAVFPPLGQNKNASPLFWSGVRRKAPRFHPACTVKQNLFRCASRVKNSFGVF